MAVNHYENFPVASVLLPPRLRAPVALIFRFARTADDFADEGVLTDSERLSLLAGFEAELCRIDRGEAPHQALFQELAIAIAQHNLPVQPFHDLLSAFMQDVTQKRYANFAAVMDYCRRSANPIGRLLLVLYGSASTQNNTRSDSICTALQLINFLQDVAIDYANGRIYMPQDEMLRFGISEASIGAKDTSEAWRRFMDFQVQRARRMLFDGAMLGRVLKGRVGLEMRMIIAGGDRILTKIANARYDVFDSRPVLRPHDWLLMTAHAVIARPRSRTELQRTLL